VTGFAAASVFIASVVFWQEPSPPSQADLTIAAVNPTPPYTFLQEDMEGTSPKVRVRDAKGIEWRVKGGHDVKAETFITRFVSALGYYAETTHFLAKGEIRDAPELKRASGFIQPDGSFTWAAFEKIESDAKFTGAWSWRDPRFQRTHEFNGLKILVMLFSNWDNKDSRDAGKGSNTSILKFADGRQVYFVNDWGQSFGEWGRYFGRSNWDCRSYREQSAQFVIGVRDGRVRFGYGGAHTEDFKNDIRVEDVRWLMQYLGQISDAQIRAGLQSAGASRDEVECFTSALRDRTEQLRRITLK